MKVKITILLSIMILLISCSHISKEKNLSLNKVFTESKTNKVDEEITSYSNSFERDKSNETENSLPYILEGIFPSEYMAVLFSEDDFLHTNYDNKEYINFEEYLSKYGYGHNMKSVNIAILDLDNDGNKEIVINMTSVAILVLHYEDGVVYGYSFGSKAMNWLKQDGSFTWVSDIYNGGWSTLRFSKNKYEYVNILEYRHDNTKEQVIEKWYYNGDSVSEKEYRKFEREQEEKEYIIWYAFPEI